MNSSKKIIKAGQVSLTSRGLTCETDQFTPSSWEGEGSPSAGYESAEASSLQDTEAVEQLIRDAYERGCRAGAEEVELQGKQEETSVLKALDAVHRECLEIKNRVFDGMEEKVVVLAIALAEKIIRQEVMHDRKVLVRSLEGIIKGIKDTTELSISLNPDDEDFIRNGGFDESNWDPSVRLVSDPALKPGDALVETAGLVIDARIIEQLDVLRSALTRGSLEDQP